MVESHPRLDPHAARGRFAGYALWRVVEGVADTEGRGSDLRGIVLVRLLLGVFMVRAAVQYDPGEGVGLDGTLRALTIQPAGPLFVALVGAGLALFGSCSLVEARYRRVLDT